MQSIKMSESAINVGYQSKVLGSVHYTSIYKEFGLTSLQFFFQQTLRDEDEEYI